MLTIIAKTSIVEWTECIIFAISVIGVYLIFFQLRKEYQQKRTEYIINYYNNLISDQELREMYYQIEYKNFVYDDSFHQSLKEKQLDRLLNYFDNVAKLYEMRRITFKDLRIIAYEYLTVFNDKAVQKYLSYLSVCFDSRGFKVKPYWAFRRVGEMLDKTYHPGASPQ